ncbi:hypothetical protein AB0M46_40540 [Dactylosporangium sp. NPDC051485]|uniref:hypothetical protein n=1 Tax=Dactylosporangium sp. NPDC051485 TaxID=3154846 RepID=UPI0034321009
MWLVFCVVLCVATGLAAWRVSSQPVLAKVRTTAGPSFERLARTASRIGYMISAVFAVLAVVVSTGSTYAMLVVGLVLMPVALVLAVLTVIAIGRAIKHRH